MNKAPPVQQLKPKAPIERMTEEEYDRVYITKCKEVVRVLMQEYAPHLQASWYSTVFDGTDAVNYLFYWDKIYLEEITVNIELPVRTHLLILRVNLDAALAKIGLANPRNKATDTLSEEDWEQISE